MKSVTTVSGHDKLEADQLKRMNWDEDFIQLFLQAEQPQSIISCFPRTIKPKTKKSKMLQGLVNTVSHVTHIPLPDLPIDVPNILPINTELVNKDGEVNIPIVGGGLFSGLLAILTGLSMPNVIEFFKNLSWEYVSDFVKNISAKIGDKIKVYIDQYLGPLKKYFKNNKVLLIYLAIAIGILLVPIILFIVFVFIAIGLGFVLFIIIEGVVITAGFIVLVVSLIPLIILLVIIGAVVFVVNWIVVKVSGGDSEENEETDEKGDGDAPQSVHSGKED